MVTLPVGTTVELISDLFETLKMSTFWQLYLYGLDSEMEALPVGTTVTTLLPTSQNTWPEGYKTFFMLNPSEHEI